MGVVEAIKELGGRALASADQIAFFILFVAFVWFAIDWILLTLG